MCSITLYPTIGSEMFRSLTKNGTVKLGKLSCNENSNNPTPTIEIFVSLAALICKFVSPKTSSIVNNSFSGKCWETQSLSTTLTIEPVSHKNLNFFPSNKQSNIGF